VKPDRSPQAPVAMEPTSQSPNLGPRGRPPVSPLVSVIGIGVQKAATSWLFRCLSQHPDFRGAQREDRDKELNFFNHNYEYGYDWYERHFERGPWQNLEFSVLYFHDANVPGRAREYNPNARLLLCLRNPVDRALSQYRHEIRKGRLTFREDGFWDALRRNPSFIEQGRYAHHLEHWLRHFDLEQFHIVEYDQIKTAPDAVLRRAFHFLGVDPEFRPSLTNERVNRSLVQGAGFVRRALGIAGRGVRFLAGDSLTERLKASHLGTHIQEYRYEEVGGREELPPGSAERARLAEFFRPDLERLEQILDRDYGHWR
jgi:hypothetical protein